jgi:diguanylate cyclase (GGDEF)-like protein
LAERLWPENLQEVQDNLSRSAGIPMLFAHVSGRPLAACEDLAAFCRTFTRSVALSRPCLGCGRLRGDRDVAVAPDRLRSLLCVCPLGLVDIAVPIRAAGEIIGHLVTAQMRPEDPFPLDDVHGPPDSEECSSLLSEAPQRTDAELAAVASALSAAAWLTGALAASRHRNLRLAEHIREQNRYFQQYVTTDAVTGVANRRHFRSSLNAEAVRARRYKRSLSVAVLDVEGFRRTNEEFGHDVGDAILRSLAECLVATVRQTDLVGRVGGDEFAILFPETTRAEAMIALARIQGQIEDLNASGDLPVEVRVTVGLVDRSAETDDLLTAAMNAEQQARPLRGAAV